MDDKRRKLRFGSGASIQHIEQIISRRKMGYEIRANKRAVNLEKMIFTSVNIGKYFHYEQPTLRPEIDISLKKKCITIEDLPPKPKIQRLSSRSRGETTKLTCITQISQRPTSHNIIHSAISSPFYSGRGSMSMPITLKRSIIPSTANLVVKSVRRMRDNQNQTKRFRRYAQLKEDSKKKL